MSLHGLRLSSACLRPGNLWQTLTWESASLVPRPRPAFRRLQYGKAVLISDRKLGGAWERGYESTTNEEILCIVVSLFRLERKSLQSKLGFSKDLSSHQRSMRPKVLVMVTILPHWFMVDSSPPPPPPLPPAECFVFVNGTCVSIVWVRRN